MPTVRTYSQQNVQQAALPERRAVTNAGPESFGAASGRQLQQVGGAVNQAADMLGNVAVRLQERQDAEDVRRAFIAFDTKARALLLDPEKGLYNRRGMDSKGVTTEATKKFDEFEADVSGSLLSPRAKQELSFRLAEVKNGHLDSLARHESQEFYKVEEETTQAFLNSSIQGAQASYANPKLRAQYKAQGEYELNRMAKLHGWSPELLDRKKHEYSTLFHTGIIDKMLIDDPTGAQQYYDENKDAIDGGKQVEIEKALKVGVTRERAYNEVERIMASTGSYKQQLDMARDIEDKALADEVVKRIKEREGERRDMRTEAERVAKDQAWAIVTQTNSMDSISPTVLAQLDGYTISAMQSFIDKKGNVKTDPVVYGSLSQMTWKDPDGFMNLNLADYRAVLSPTDLQEVMGWQRALVAGQQRADASAGKFDSVASIKQRVDSLLDSQAVDDKEQRGVFHTQAGLELQRAQTAKGRDLTMEEIDQVLTRMALEGKVRNKGMFSREEYSLYEVMGTPDEENFYVPKKQIPNVHLEKISKALEKTGQPVTEANVEKMFMLMVKAGTIDAGDIVRGD